jgi:DNA replication protein DnaC
VTAQPTVLLAAHLKALRLPTFLREYDKIARQCAQEGLDCPRSLLRLCELELLDREQRATERRIKAAKFPVLKSLETFEFRAIPSVNKSLVLELARSAYLTRRENVLALGNSGTGKTHLALALGLAACQQGARVRFTTAAALVNELLEARDDQHLLRVQKQLAKQDLLIVDELGYVPLSKTGAELLFEVFSQRYEQASTLVTSNLPFNAWTEIFGSDRLTGALLDRLTHHVHILELNGESYRLAHSKKARRPADAPPAGWSGFPPPPWSNFAPPLTSVATELVGHEPRRFLALALQEFPNESARRTRVPAGLDEEVDQVPVLVHGAPEILAVTVNRDEDFVQKPRIAESTLSALQPPGVVWAELRAPLPNGFVRHDDASFGQQILDSRKLRSYRWYNHTAWLMMSDGKRCRR